MRPALLAAGLLELALLGAAAVAGVGSFDAYPTISMDTDPRRCCWPLALPAIAMSPFLPDAIRRRRRSRRG